jgi:hypothetical protein
MSIQLASGLPKRIIEVLRDYLSAELDLIDAAENDGLITPDVPAINYYDWDLKLIQGYPACSIRSVSSSPIEVWNTMTSAKQIHARHRFDVMFHGHIGMSLPTLAPDQLNKIMMRYVAGAARALCVMHPALQTIADPSLFVELVEWTDTATYGPEEEQESGAIVRTSTLPIEIRRHEIR